MVDYYSREHWTVDFEVEVSVDDKSDSQLDEIFLQLKGYATKIENILSRDNSVAEVHVEWSDGKIILAICSDAKLNEGQEFYDSAFGKQRRENSRYFF